MPRAMASQHFTSDLHLGSFPCDLGALLANRKCRPQSAGLVFGLHFLIRECMMASRPLCHLGRRASAAASMLSAAMKYPYSQSSQEDIWEAFQEASVKLARRLAMPIHFVVLPFSLRLGVMTKLQPSQQPNNIDGNDCSCNLVAVSEGGVL